MRSFIYTSLMERLKQLKDEAGQPAVKHYDLWNEQVEFIEQEAPFATPAVFVEFRPVQWTTLGGQVQQADLTVRLHIVTPWQGSAAEGSLYQEQSLRRFDLLDRIDDHLWDFAASDGTCSVFLFRRSASHTNHNHGELVEDVTDYTCRVTQQHPVRTA